MKNFLIIVLLSVFSFGIGHSQSLEEEIEFKYIKAKYLLDTERYEDAIKAFTSIVKENEEYSDALLLRAKAKYAMAAYKGTKKDILLYAGNKGVSKDAIILLGKADYKMGNNDAAINSLSAASMLGVDDPQVYEFLGNLYDENDDEISACKEWQKAAKLGSSKATIKVKKHCGGVLNDEVTTKPKRNTGRGKMDSSTLPTKSDDRRNSAEVVDNTGMKDDRTPEQKRRDADDSLNSPTKENAPEINEEDEVDIEDEVEEGDTQDEQKVPVIEEEQYKMPEEDNTPNEIEIDEDLSLVIRGQGLGLRRVLDQPNILILADEDGTVAIDICVNKRGKVESAEFNGKLSTIAKKSLVSLAIRKSKDFWFEKNDYKEQCGVILFKIKGS